MSEAILELRDVRKWFPITAGLMQMTVGHVRAVDGVSLSVMRGETLGLVGESGCGKSTLGRMAVKLLEPTRGSVHYAGKDICHVRGKALAEFRRCAQIIFQDPYSSLNPRMTAGAIIGEGLRIHRLVPRNEVRDRVSDLLERVGLDRSDFVRYPHEFSGGQRQRLGIARALAVEPDFIVCDEPVSALDVSIQAQIVELLKALQSDLGLSYLFVAHDLAVVRHISDRVAVMYLGQLCELAPRNIIYDFPAHPYTQALLSAVPEPDPTIPLRPRPLPGEVPSAARPPSGCRFHPRCPLAEPICRTENPEWRELGPGHFVACHLASEQIPTQASTEQ
ncbi:MAG: ABC transporter ATP-binding protein [Armatimonadetes bacterium]|jgi:oligopeptide/dipeptide ABC transporter ATP-binding protein|nr:ABC transporter ATP-binding protein [Armatimonadota bacterium]MDI9583522.1 ABC transporter ATP-binding protein [Acidobacteriota bacterium]